MIRLLLALVFLPVMASANGLSQSAFVEFQNRCIDPLSEGDEQNLDGLARLNKIEEQRVISILRADVTSELYDIAGTDVLIAKSAIPQMCQVIGFGHDVSEVARTYEAWSETSGFTSAADFPAKPNPSKPAGVFLARQMPEGDFMQMTVSVSVKLGGFLALTTTRVPDSPSARQTLKLGE